MPVACSSKEASIWLVFALPVSRATFVWSLWIVCPVVGLRQQAKPPNYVRLYHHEGITLSRKTSRVTKKSLNANMYVIGRPDIHETPQNSIDHIWPIHFTNLALLCYFIRPYTAHTFHKSSSLMLFYYDPNLYKSLLVLTERARPRREAGLKRSGSLPI